MGGATLEFMGFSLDGLLQGEPLTADASGEIDAAIGRRLAALNGKNFAEADRILFSVEDNGVGITADNLQKIFQHGFTTRKDGHGFGLHSGAIAARNLGGEVEVHSDGPGRGARFTLNLPSRAQNSNTSRAA